MGGSHSCGWKLCRFVGFSIINTVILSVLVNILPLAFSLQSIEVSSQVRAKTSASYLMLKTAPLTDKIKINNLKI